MVYKSVLATSGSILGIIHGRKNLPARWVDRINDTLHTGVTGYHTVKLADIARETIVPPAVRDLSTLGFESP